MPRDATIVVDEVIEFCAELMSSGKRKFEIKREIEAIFGHRISADSYEKIRRRARALILAKAAMSKDEHFAQCLNALYDIAADMDARPGVRIKAINSVAELVGIGGKFSHDGVGAEEKAKQIRSFADEADKTVPE